MNRIEPALTALTVALAPGAANAQAAGATAGDASRTRRRWSIRI